MISGRAPSIIIIDEHWTVYRVKRAFGCRYGCDRSRQAVDRFFHNPESIDRIARLTIEAGSSLRAGKAVRHV